MKKNIFKVMIADDDPDDLDYLKFLLNHHERFAVSHSFTNGKDVLDALSTAKNPPHILITDLYMPGMDGAEVVAHLLKHNIAPDMRIFIISTTISKALEEKFAGTNVRFIKKPFTLVEFNDLPEHLLECLNAGHINRI